jgi:hypothetical protein
MDRCPKGFIRRKGYTRKNTGTQVKSTCVRSTIKVNKNTQRSCPPGELLRKSYVRRFSSKVHTEGYTRKTKSGKNVKVYPKVKSVFVKPSCIKDVGKPGKLAEGAPRIGPLRKGELKKFGYLYKLPDAEREAALKKAVNALGPLNVFHKLDAVAKLSLTSAPAASAIFTKDRNWIRKIYANSNGIIRAF